MVKSPFLWLMILLLLAGLLAWQAPLEKTLGESSRLIYFHGAWVWAAMSGLVIAALLGAIGLLRRSWEWHAWSRAWARSGLVFWLIFLPMSLVVMQVSWNGIFWDEPRFRIPLNLAIVGLLLQAGLAMLPAGTWSSLANLAYGAALWFSMNQAEAILHPEAPILHSDSRALQRYFFGILIVLLAACWQLARLWRQQEKRPGGQS